jgi:2-polyprenyl-3-methyl-5-hydroxy-6-metoxy-1,4-benzoquinol methylase
MHESSPGATCDLDIFGYQVCNDTRTKRNDGVGFETPVAQWSYALSFALPRSWSAPFVVELTFDPHAGRVGAGCVDDSISRYASGEALFDAAEGEATKTIHVDDPRARFLILRNVSENGSSLGTVKRIALRRTHDYSAADLKRMRASRYAYWHYSFDLGDGVTVAATLDGIMGVHRLNQRILFRLIDDSFDLSGHKTCLDAACSSGYHSFGLAAKGLSVVAIDIDAPSIEQALFVQSCVETPTAKSVQFRRQDLLELETSTQYDVVFCSGLFYHLQDLVGGARKLFAAARAGAVVHSFVSAAAGDVLELADVRKYCCCFPGEFSFVPTASLLERILVHVGFTDVRRYTTAELCREPDIASLEPAYADLMRKHTAYYVARK